MDEDEKFRQRAKAAGYTDAEVDEYLAKEKATSANPLTGAGARNLGRSLAAGATFNLNDELAGVGAALVPGGKGYSEARDEVRANDKAFKEAHPWIAGGAELAGGLAVPGVGAWKTIGKGAKTIRGAVKTGAAVGAGTGAAYGAGGAEGGLSDRAKAAVVPAVLGGVLGGAIPGAAGGLKSAFGKATRANTRLNSAIERSGGEDKLLQTLEEFKTAGRGDDVMLGDLSVPLRQTTDFAVNASEPTADLIGTKAYGRFEDASDRILQDTRSVVGNPRAEKIIKDLKKGTAEWADGPEGYGGLREQNPVIVPAMAERFQKLLKTSAVNKAYNQAKEVGLIGPDLPDHSTSFDVMQGVVDRVTTAKEMAFSKGANDLAFKLKSAEKALRDELEIAVPGYKEISAQYHIRKTAERMVEAGQKAYKQKDTRGLSELVGGLNADELTKFREGMASELIAHLRDTGTGKDVAKSLVKASPATKDKIQVIFGSDKVAAEFMEKMRIEWELSKILSTLTGSQTAKRLAAQQGIDPLELAVDIGTIPVAPWSGMSKLAGIFGRATKSKMGAATAGELGPRLATQGAGAIEDLLKQIKNNPRSLLGRGSSVRLPAALGHGAGLLTDAE